MLDGGDGDTVDVADDAVADTDGCNTGRYRKFLHTALVECLLADGRDALRKYDRRDTVPSAIQDLG